MGVSLERVQFKFASIIGELCSDPDVLSQFAVWLDLRLAEYKLKGAISLDCSGEEPNPLWLKGINKGKNKAVDDPVTPHRSNRTSRERARDPFPHHMTSPSQTEANPSPMERMSPEVVIKEEPSDIYPIQVHAHQNVNASFSSGSRRKRSAAETLTGDSWSQEIHDISSLSSSSSPKHKRLSSTGDSPSNQSLMSVIGGFHDNAEESTSKGDNSYNPLESSGNSASNATAMYQSDISPDFTAEPSCSFNQPSSSQDYDISIQDPAQQIQSESSENSSANEVIQIPMQTDITDLKSRPPRAGIMSASLAERYSMVELVTGTGVYLDQGSYNLALTKCCLPPRKTRPKKVEQVKHNDGRPAARYLLGIFFSAEDLANSTTSHKSGRPKLDDRIIQAIKVFCVKNSSCTLSEISIAIRCKLTGFRSRRLQKAYAGRSEGYDHCQNISHT
ncbi:uncharacterized protein LOC135463852 isoform X2 [Liolophura sinensis]|uniref:uncharacterized protein LOC135463852 isoform X2 n=1 Tax=Liolophura sinensis TaxID=3198878 RepID=UPI003158D084